jgi:hypothetical protein
VRIGENSAITLPIVIAIVGVVYWLSEPYFVSNRNAVDIATINSKIDSLNQNNERIARMESKIDIIYEMVINDGRKRKPTPQE